MKKSIGNEAGHGSFEQGDPFRFKRRDGPSRSKAKGESRWSPGGRLKDRARRDFYPVFAEA